MADLHPQRQAKERAARAAIFARHPQPVEGRHKDHAAAVGHRRRVPVEIGDVPHQTDLAQPIGRRAGGRHIGFEGISWRTANLPRQIGLTNALQRRIRANHRIHK